MLKQRIITALWLLPVALIGFFVLSGWAFTLFLCVVLGLAGWEWARLIGLPGSAWHVVYAGLTLVLFILLQFAGIERFVLSVALLWWCLAAWMVLRYPASMRLCRDEVSKMLLGWLIILPAGIGLLTLKSLPHGNMLILCVMLLVWTADVAAYFSGRAFGKRKLAPQVSPGKSWAGLLGGLLASQVIALGFALYFALGFAQVLLFLLVSAVIVLFSVVGDLTESMFKRKAEVKDSSNLLPGHGGVLDRVDSLTAAVPLFALFLLCSGWAVAA